MKRFTVLFSKQSIIDIEEAIVFYNEQQRGLGNTFHTDFEKTYKSIIINPYFASVKYDNVRCATLNKFPFSVHYIVDDTTLSVLIVSVFNTWKEPFW
jgi:hypothetical protein